MSGPKPPQLYPIPMGGSNSSSGRGRPNIQKAINNNLRLLRAQLMGAQKTVDTICKQWVIASPGEAGKLLVLITLLAGVINS